MALEVKLEVFEGPLDLLLHLIEKNKVDIYDIPIVEITEQYLDYIRQMQTEDMNVMSEFLLMAATLLDIKCRMLLPREINEEGEEEDPRAELVEKLLEYKMYKYMSFELRDMELDAAKSFYLSLIHIWKKLVFIIVPVQGADAVTVRKQRCRIQKTCPGIRCSHHDRNQVYPCLLYTSPSAHRRTCRLRSALSAGLPCWKAYRQEPDTSVS